MMTRCALIILLGSPAFSSGATLSGHITSAEGTPISDATVFIYTASVREGTSHSVPLNCHKLSTGKTAHFVEETIAQPEVRIHQGRGDFVQLACDPPVSTSNREERIQHAHRHKAGDHEANHRQHNLVADWPPHSTSRFRLGINALRIHGEIFVHDGEFFATRK